MGIAGLGTYSSSSYYYAAVTRSRNTSDANSLADFGGLMAQSEGTNVATSNNTSVATRPSYTRCITANIMTEEMFASQNDSGEMIYSYQRTEQSFQIYINSDGDKKTYTINGVDKDGNAFEKEFDPYDVDPENADFPEFAALCMYIQQTDATADMLANDYFSSDDILERCNYLDKLEGFSSDSFFEKAQYMVDSANRLVALLNQIVDVRNDIDSFFEPFFTRFLVEDVNPDEYPNIADGISEDLSAEKTNTETEETLTQLGFGFANAGNMGYGMSAALVEKPGCDDTIIRVNISTGNGTETIDVNLSKFDPKNATAVEMFAYCKYMDAIGEGVDSKWGSWNAMKNISSPYDGCDFGSLDNIMNKKMNWSGKLAQSQTSWMDPKTNKIIMSPADLIKMLEESHKLTAKELKEEKDWREMSDDEWDKMLAGIDKYIDAYKERLTEMRKMQEEAAQKAALEAESGMKAIAASSAALSAANGFDGSVSTETEVATEGALPSMDEADHENNWTKKLKTDNQTILMTAKEAQKMEEMAQRKLEDIVNDSEYQSYEYISVIDQIDKRTGDIGAEKEPLKLIAMDRNGIRCINDETNEVEWEIKFNSEHEYKKAANLMKWIGMHMNDSKAAADEKMWSDYLSGSISEGSFKNALRGKVA